MNAEKMIDEYWFMFKCHVIPVDGLNIFDTVVVTLHAGDGQSSDTLGILLYNVIKHCSAALYIQY